MGLLQILAEARLSCSDAQSLVAVLRSCRDARVVIDVVKLLRDHVQRFAEEPNVVETPQEIVDSLPLICSTMRGGRQEDAQEFIRHLLEALQRQCLQQGGLRSDAVGRVAETSFVHRVFGGYLRSQVRCEHAKCGFVSDM